MRKITVQIIIGDEFESSYAAIDTDTAQVRVSTKEADKYNVPPYVILAHELGHVVGTIAGLPGNSAPGFQRHMNPDLTLQAEHEAWDIAESMIKGIRKRQIARYEKSISSVNWVNVSNYVMKGVPEHANIQSIDSAIEVEAGRHHRGEERGHGPSDRGLDEPKPTGGI